MKIFSYIDELYKGRVGRIHYLFGTLLFSILFYVLLFILNFVFSLGSERFGNSTPHVTLYIIIISLLFISFIIHITSLIIRRLHDMGKSGYYILVLFFIPIANLVIAIMLLAGRGQAQVNTYGEPTSGYTFFNSIFNIRLNQTK